MSDDLLEWLDCPCSSEVCLPRAAKARIEAQAAELVRIKERLGWRIEEQAVEIDRLRNVIDSLIDRISEAAALASPATYPIALAGKAEQ